MKYIPPPPYTVGKPLRALIFDSKYDSYKVTLPPPSKIVSHSAQSGPPVGRLPWLLTMSQACTTSKALHLRQAWTTLSHSRAFTLLRQSTSS